MCPGCVASVAWVAIGVGSTGGLTALAAKLLPPKKIGERTKSETKKNETKER